MKYVRTNNNEIYKYVTDFDEYIIVTTNGMSAISIKKTDIIKEAETIEELTDRYVLDKIDIIILNKEHTQYRFEGSDEWFDITDTELIKGIYCAIWAECGLKYAAKMNMEREFELWKD